MKQITFYNNSPLDMRAVKTFGLSVKETDNPVGFFGTGFKYAIAVCVREGVPLRIYTQEAGEEKMYEFTKRTQQFRGADYESIYMNGEELPFTTELGKNWKLWGAFRELIANALDEDGGITDGECYAPTRIVLYGPKAAATFARRREIYLEGVTVDTYARECEVILKKSEYLYYRGFRVYTLELPTRFTYNVLIDLDLTEDRTLQWSWQADAVIERAIAESDDKAFIKKILTAGEAYYEHHLDYSHLINSRVSFEFLEVVKELYSDFSGRVGKGVKHVYETMVKEDKMPTESVPITNVQQAMLDKAKEVCRNLEYPVDKYPLIIVDSLGAGVKGLAFEDTVYLSKEVFEDGTKWVAGTLMEELIHLETGYADYTRGLQNHLINKIMSMYEDWEGEPL